MTMPFALPPLALLLLACAAEVQPEFGIERAIYVAQGDAAGWNLAIGQSGAVLSIGDRATHYGNLVLEEAGGIRRWSGGEGTAVIEVVATPGACTLRGYPWNDRVRVRLSGRELDGCGSAAPAPETN